MTSKTTNPWPEADPSILAPVSEHDDLRDVVRQMLVRESDLDSVRQAVGTPKGYSTEVWARFNGELELGATLVPVELGGAGFGLREMAVVLEETGAALSPEPVLASAVLGAAALSLAEDPALVADVRRLVVSGAKVATVALDDASITAHGSAGGEWTLSGTVPRVLQGGAADYYVVPANGRLFLVDRQADGVGIDQPEVLDFTRRQARLTFDCVSATQLVGREGFARAWQRLQTLATIAVASEHVGIIDRALRLSTEYVQQRHQFGRAIGSFQAIKHRLADVLVDLERARSAAGYAAACFDDEPEGALLPAQIAGAMCTDAVVRASHEMVQLHGGIGFTWEHAAHFYVRRALGDEGLFGDARAHRARIADLVGV